jgi:hypothetical protein
MKGTKIGIACLLLGLIVSATGARADENQTLATAKNAIVAVADTSFVDSQFKAAMIDDLNAAAELFLMATAESERAAKNGLYQDALNTAETMIAKTDGCIKAGAPEIDDWLTLCADAATVHAKLVLLRQEIAGLIVVE